MPPKLTKCVWDRNDTGEAIRRWVKEDELTADDFKSSKRKQLSMASPFSKRRRKKVNQSITNSLSDIALDEMDITQPLSRKANGVRSNLDEADTNAPSSEGSRERISTKSYKTSRGLPDRSTAIVEKQPSIEDAVYIYRTLMNNGTRPPIFLQRNLVYLCRQRKRSRKKGMDFEGLLENLASLASVCSQLQLTLTNLLNIKLFPGDRKEITVDVYLQKNCYKRRKTDVTTKEKLIKSIRLTNPPYFGSDNHSVLIDTTEISSDVGAHHMSACYLKVKVTITTEKRSKATSTSYKKAKKKYYVEPVEPKYQLKEFVSTLLLYSGGKSYLPSGKQTLFLHEMDKHTNEQCAPQYMDWDDLSSTPQLVFETQQHTHRRSARSSSPSKHTSSLATPALANHKQANELSQPISLKSNHLTNRDSATTPSPVPNETTGKLYFVLQYKGAPQTTVQVGYTCPFCLRKTRPASVVFLLKHMRLCHSRLLFLYRETDGEPAIIVTVNTYYDGSYCGNPLDHVPSLGDSVPLTEAFKRDEPTRRTPYTEVLNIRANRKPLSLEEFSKPEPLPLISSTSSLLGHNRLYYHSVSNQPVLSNDFDADSDGEDTEWSRIASSRLIDEFIDVNKGEKELMKLWNNFISKNTQYISDVQIETACLVFIREHSEILSFKLRNNFLCHLATLYDSGVLQTKNINTIIEALPKKFSGNKGKAPLNGHHVYKA